MQDIRISVDTKWLHFKQIYSNQILYIFLSFFFLPYANADYIASRYGGVAGKVFN